MVVVNGTSKIIGLAKLALNVMGLGSFGSHMHLTVSNFTQSILEVDFLQGLVSLVNDKGILEYEHFVVPIFNLRSQNVLTHKS